MINEEDQRIVDAVKRAAAHFNDTQCEEEMVVSQLLEGDDAVNFLEALMNAAKRMQAGQISAEQALQIAEEWNVPEERSRE